jgi:hypothetical protein
MRSIFLALLMLSCSVTIKGRAEVDRSRATFEADMKIVNPHCEYSQELWTADAVCQARIGDRPVTYSCRAKGCWWWR